VSGIGEKLAENIVNYRSENGPFEDRNNKKNYLVWAKKPFNKVLLLLKTGKTHWITRPFILKPIQWWPKIKLKVTDLIANKETA
jgi:uncharacterized protein